MEKPHFFKVMFLDFHERLRIPRTFLKHLLEESSQAATLEGPSGDLWHVKLDRKKDDIYLADGWETFRKDHSLEIGEFVVFEYDGNMHFRAQIFSRNGCEREDAFAVKCSQQLRKPRGIKTHRSLLKDFEGKKRSRPFTTFPESIHLSRHTKKRRKNRIPENNLSHQSDQSDSVKVQVMGSRLSPPKPDRLVVYQGLEPEEAAHSFTSSFPHFKIIMKSYSVDRPFHLNIPSRFSKEHLPPSSNKMFLQNLEGKRWIVTLYMKPKRSLFCGGWRAFSNDNNLRRGDYCVFELLSEFEMKVHIFRVGSKISCSSICSARNAKT